MSKVEYFSETAKIRPLVEQYVSGAILDIGCGTEKIDPKAIGIDVRKTPAVDVVVPGFDKLSAELAKQNQLTSYQTIFSSHCLEHLQDDMGALADWFSMLTFGGHLILYLPDDDHYDNDANPEHLHRYTYEAFRQTVEDRFSPGLRIVDGGPHVGDDLYSFWLVAKRWYSSI